MGAIDNSNLLNYRESSGTSGFVPKVTYVHDAGNEEVDFADESTFPDGVALAKTHVRVHDKFGNSVHGFILPTAGPDSGHDGETTLDISGLDISGGLDVTATVVADDGKLVADGGAYNIGLSGELGGWDKQKNA